MKNLKFSSSNQLGATAIESAIVIGILLVAFAVSFAIIRKNVEKRTAAGIGAVGGRQDDTAYGQRLLMVPCAAGGLDRDTECY
jgi:hypothetical protein